MAVVAVGRVADYELSNRRLVAPAARVEGRPYGRKGNRMKPVGAGRDDWEAAMVAVAAEDDEGGRDG